MKKIPCNPLEREINNILNEADLTPKEDKWKGRRLITLLTVAIYHQRGIYDLISLDNITSASALYRVQYESHIKATWLYEKASEKESNQALTRDKWPKTGQMIEDIGCWLGNMEIKAYHKERWKEMNTYVHSGKNLIDMLNLKDEEYIKRHAEIANTLSYFSNRTSSLALMGIGRIIDSIDIQKTGYRLFKQYAPPMDITLPL